MINDTTWLVKTYFYFAHAALVDPLWDERGLDGANLEKYNNQAKCWVSNGQH